MDIKIGSLNCLNLGRESVKKKDIELIARIIVREKFDVIALQEIKNGAIDFVTQALDRLSGKGVWCGCADNNDYAFIWNT